MVDTAQHLPSFTEADLPDRMTEADLQNPTRYTEAALERHKREGLDLAVRARLWALAATGVMLPFLNPSWEMLYYEVMLVLVALNGLLLRRVGRVGRSGLELLVIFFDLLLLTVILVVPNPFSSESWPDAMGYRFSNFMYFYIILAAGTLAFSWRTIFALGNWTAVMWLLGVAGIWYFGQTDPALDDATAIAFGADTQMAKILNPNGLNFDIRLQEVVVFVIVAYTLGISVRRFNKLLLGSAALERERANLSRYFSPNVVDELSRNDEPLKQIRSQNVAVLFVDIVGFTPFAADRTPEDVIGTLRQFHGRMEDAVFQNGGTLDKYLGDGLMATFGTPVTTPSDATNALRCAMMMLASMDQWNTDRRMRGEESIQISVGLHFGPVVLGDIGANRLEFAVIGNTVNTAARLEALTRTLSTKLVLSDEMRQQILTETADPGHIVHQLRDGGAQDIRGLPQPVQVWTMP